MNNNNNSESHASDLGPQTLDLKNYTFPAEWEEHEATWLSWPHKEESWPERIDLIYPAYAQFIAELTKGEFVCINVKDQEMQAFACGVLYERHIFRQSFPGYHQLASHCDLLCPCMLGRYLYQ